MQGWAKYLQRCIETRIQNSSTKVYLITSETKIKKKVFRYKIHSSQIHLFCVVWYLDSKLLDPSCLLPLTAIPAKCKDCAAAYNNQPQGDIATSAVQFLLCKIDRPHQLNKRSCKQAQANNIGWTFFYTLVLYELICKKCNEPIFGLLHTATHLTTTQERKIIPRALPFKASPMQFQSSL